MSKKVKVEGRIITVPDDATPDEIDEIATGKVGGAAPPSNTVTGRIGAQPSFPSAAWFKSKFYTGADKGTNLLPAAGGIAGGIVGGTAGTVEPGAGNVIGAISGAALGGAAGEAARQHARRALGFEDAPTSSLDAAKQIGTEGLKQGAYEAGGQVVGRIGRAVAPKVAEAAMSPGIRALKELPEQAEPIGKTVLKESTAYRPKVIAKQLRAKVEGHSNAMDSELRTAGDQGVTVPLTPARQQIADESILALKQNSPNYIEDVNKVRDQLKYEYGPDGEPLEQVSAATRPGAGFTPVEVPAGTTRTPIELPDAVPPLRARQLRQGIDKTISNWNPESQANIGPLKERVHGAIAGAIHDAVPSTIEHDAAMTNIIPAETAARNIAFKPGLTRSVIDVFNRPTGALVGSITGAGAGYKEGGVGGALAGGIGGLLLPRLVTSPTGLMIGARALDSQFPARAVRYAVPIGEGLMKPDGKRLKDDGAEDSQ